MRAIMWESTEASALVDSEVVLGNPLVALQALQSQYGFVHPEAIDLVAGAFNISRAEVFGIVTYYSDFRTEPLVGTNVRVCMGEACQAVGARSLNSEVEHYAAEHSDARLVTTEVFCMGNCALGPTAVVGETLIGLATVDKIVSQLKREPS
ncbi:MAG: NAD(P)H-dependent oxidoreductase subunit E [Candidatus Nanopelagicales bacterium]